MTKMMNRLFFGAALATILTTTVRAGDTYSRADWVAVLTPGEYDSRGIARIIDERTIQIDQFTYDGTAPAVYFYLGETNTQEDFENGIPIGPLLGAYDNETVVVQLDEGETLDGWGAISVWCVTFDVNFTSAAFEPPMQVVTASGFDFVPADITIDPGETVRWVWFDGNHTVTEGTDGTPDGDELFDLVLNAANPEVEFTFDGFEDTVVDYFCLFHFNFGMTGTVTVLAGPCEGDANGDGTVDPLDSGFVLARFGCPVGTGDASCDAADQNGDGSVDPLDSGFVLARFGECS